ncbi:hypothetical protein BDR05DRAFT_961225, partial [Suillus weaverae]
MTSSSNLPPNITSVPAGTPPTDWASKTESMLQSDVVTPDPAMRATPKPEQHPVTTTTNLNTPGHEFPGSYPREFEQEQQQQPRGDGSEGPMATSAVQAAKQYMPEPVERTVEYAGQTAAAYLPIPQGVKKTVASYWSNDEDSQPKETQLDQTLSTSLPSSELKGAQPCEHVGGVGSLPGTISESSVALLPDERAERDSRTPINLKKDVFQTRGDNQAKSAANPSVATAVAAKPELSILSQDLSSRAQPSQYGTQIDPQELDKSPTQQTDQYPVKLFDTKPVSVDHIPKHEVLEGQRSHDAETVGVGGAAIGATQIRAQPSCKTTENKAAKSAVAGGAVGASESMKEAGVDDTVRDNKEGPAHGEGAKVLQQPGDEELTNYKGVENRSGGVGKNDEDIKHTHKAGARTRGYDTDYHPAKLHPPRVGESTSQAETHHDSPVSPVSAPPASVTGSPKERRVSFLDKLRGEAKIIAGKMIGKEDKVEEGKRIMHGEV